MKLLSRLGHAALLAAFVSTPAAAFAQGSVTTEQLLSLIQEQQRQINELKSQLGKVEGTAEQASAKADTVKQEIGKPDFLKTVKIGGLIEVEATNAEAFSGVDSSDVALAKVELYADASPVEFVNTHVQLLFEDGDNNIVLDEAYATLGDMEKLPLFVTGGQWAMPFGGAFDTDMSADPLTKNLGETKEGAILVGAAWQGFMLETYVYNGDTTKQGSSQAIDQFGASLSYAREFQDGAVSVGAGYINNIADSDGLTDALGGAASTLSSYVAGGEVHGEIGYMGFRLRGAYMTALDSFRSGEVAFNGSGARPEAWAVEFVYGTEFFGKATTFAATVQGTDEALALGLPKTRYGIAATVEVFPHASVTAEYLHDKDYDVATGGTGESGHTGTLKLAVDF